MSIASKSYAKINLFLEITGKRPDGYHDLESVFLEIDLADTLEADIRDDGEIRMTCDDASIPVDDTNLVIRAAKLLRAETGSQAGIFFNLHKKIPAGGGLGGGSSNAATALILANQLWRIGLSRNELAKLAEKIGSDVPFFLHGGLCLCEGRGEKVTPLTALNHDIKFGLLMPPWIISTAAAYAKIDVHRTKPIPIRPFLDALMSKDPQQWAALAFNRMEYAASKIEPRYPLLNHLLEREKIPHPRLSGSGSAIWFHGETEQYDWTAITPSFPGLQTCTVSAANNT